MKDAIVGDMILVPYSKDKKALCQIVWMSKKIKNCMGMVVLSASYEGGFSDCESPLSINIPAGKITTIYTSTEDVEKGIWPVIGNKNVIDLGRYITHNIGGGLYEGDNFIRYLNRDEYGLFPKVLSSGRKAVEILLGAFGDQNK